MRNKRGLLLEESFLKLVLGAIVFLLILGVVVYGFNLLSQGQDQRNAKKALDVLEAKSNSLENGMNTTAKLQGPCKGNTCNWFVTGWSKADNNVPEQCLLKTCICVCEGSYDDSSRKTTCEKSQVCAEIKAQGISIAGDVSVPVYNTGTPSVAPSMPANLPTGSQTLPVIKFQTNLIEISISKVNDIIQLKLS